MFPLYIHRAGHSAVSGHNIETSKAHRLRAHGEADRAPEAATRGRPPPGDPALQRASAAHARQPRGALPGDPRPRRHVGRARGDVRLRAGGPRARELVAGLSLAQAAGRLDARARPPSRALCRLGRGRPSADALLAGGFHLPHGLPHGRAADGGAPTRRVHRLALLGVWRLQGGRREPRPAARGIYMYTCTARQSIRAAAAHVMACYDAPRPL